MFEYDVFLQTALQVNDSKIFLFKIEEEFINLLNHGRFNFLMFPYFNSYYKRLLHLTAGLFYLFIFYLV
jgi:hypothetical protein